MQHTRARTHKKRQKHPTDGLNEEQVYKTSVHPAYVAKLQDSDWLVTGLVIFDSRAPRLRLKLSFIYTNSRGMSSLQ